ncbi:MAG TPA: zinc-dependent alcohol dehydrogenase [Amnibacterium sp.]|nr:zinc-dependent alcohol dehydrogenase [Amnibacterium sp.]
MKAICWTGIDRVSVETVDDPAILNDQDVILKVRLSAACGSDLHLLDGYIPTMRSGDVLGHEFLGEVVEVGAAVTRHKVGDRVVVGSFIACGRCWYCRTGQYSLCDNGNPNPGIPEALWGQSPGGCFGYSHALGGYAGSHAEYVRVPFADVGAFTVPDDVSDERAVFASDAVPTGWMGADLGGVQPGDVVAVWGAGAVGQMAARAAMLLGAERVVVIDRFEYRLGQVVTHVGAETIDYSTSEVIPTLKEMTGGRGPDVCIEAVGMEAHRNRVDGVYDYVKQQLRMQTGRPTAVREAIEACRKGGSVFVLGVFGGVVDKFPLGALMNKGLRFAAAQQHGQRYIPMLLERMQRGEIVSEHLATHVLPLDEASHGYGIFKHKQDDCVRPVFRP